MADIGKSWNNLYDELDSVMQLGADNPKRFHTIRKLVDELRNLILYDDTSKMEYGGILVHYTSWDNALMMFGKEQAKSESAIRMYNYELANDPEEGNIRPPVWEQAEEIAQAELFNKFLRTSDRLEGRRGLGNTYGCSFSSGSSESVRDDMTYWRMYGDDGRGCSLRISPGVGTSGMYRVRYRDRNYIDTCNDDKKEDNEIGRRLEALIGLAKETVSSVPEDYTKVVGATVSEVLFQLFCGFYHLIKHLAYEDEKEWRMIKVMPRPSEIQFDTNFGQLIKRYVQGLEFRNLLTTSSVLTIGPTVPNPSAARAYLEHLVRQHHGINYVTVMNSNQSYRQKPSSIR